MPLRKSRMALELKTEVESNTRPSRTSNDVWVEFAEPAGCLDSIQVEDWVRAARTNRTGIVCVRFVNEEEGRYLNCKFRRVFRATNVLAFPANEKGILGDIAICIPLAVQESVEQGKTLAAHLAHLVVHGTLHLCGFDHENSREAEKMEAKEIQILHALGFENPYIQHD